MRLVIKIILAIGLITFVVIQFFQPQKNSSEISENHIFKQEQLPENVQQMLKNACIDCHSNNTNYPWYNNIAPVSWMVNKHIAEGKKELNFSEWGEMDNYDKIGTLEDIRKEVEQKAMPLKSYVIMHKDARLSDEERAALFAWIDKKGEDLLKSSIEK